MNSQIGTVFACSVIFCHLSYTWGDNIGGPTAFVKSLYPIGAIGPAQRNIPQDFYQSSDFNRLFDQRKEKKFKKFIIIEPENKISDAHELDEDCSINEDEVEQPQICQNDQEIDHLPIVEQTCQYCDAEEISLPPIEHNCCCCCYATDLPTIDTCDHCCDIEETPPSVCLDIEINKNCDYMSAGFNAPVIIESDCCQQINYFFWFSFLFWQAEQNFMDIAFESPSAIRNSACGVSWVDGKVVEMDASFQPGFMLGADYVLPCHDNWDLSAEYTHLNTKNSKGAVDPINGFLYARWIQPNLISNNAAFSLCDSWQLEFNVLNLEIGRSCYIGTRFTTRPYIGVAGAWIGQKFKGNISLITPPLLLKVMDKSNSWEIGPRIGMDGNWYITDCFSIEGNIATDILFAHYHLKLHQRATNDPTIFLTSSNDINTVRQELEMYLGLSYEFDCSSFYYSLQAGYDFQVWWNQNMIRWFNDVTYIATPQGNLYLQGLRVTFTIGF